MLFPVTPCMWPCPADGSRRLFKLTWPLDMTERKWGWLQTEHQLVLLCHDWNKCVRLNMHKRMKKSPWVKLIVCTFAWPCKAREFTSIDTFPHCTTVGAWFHEQLPKIHTHFQLLTTKAHSHSAFPTKCPYSSCIPQRWHCDCDLLLNPLQPLSCPISLSQLDIYF